MGWLLGGYFGGWYILFGVGYVYWLSEPSHRETWGMVAFGAFGYFVCIPGLLFGLMHLLGKLTERSEASIAAGLERRAVSRGYVFAVGFGGSLVAMATCTLGYMVAALSQDTLTETLGEIGLAVLIMALLMGPCAIVTGCLWLGMRHLLTKCRLREPGEQPSWTERLVPIVALLVWAGTMTWLGYRLANATTVMTARLDYAVLPVNDESLQEWLRSQPGIAAASVRRQGNTVVVECAMPAHRSHSFMQIWKTVTIEYTLPGGERRTLPLSDEAAKVGYKGLGHVEFGKPRAEW
jgi:hypothetical protein